MHEFKQGDSWGQEFCPIQRKSSRELNSKDCTEHVKKWRARGTYDTIEAKEERAGISQVNDAGHGPVFRRRMHHDTCSH